ncbi:DUF3427 domain-containing protein [Butyricicoccus sp. AM29-23AC]|nr:DUF3427 domain-containing protein [Butyricicoccus sp. AM29-23AC]
MLKQGLYEQVVNTEIKDELRQLPEDSKHIEKIDAAESSSVLTQYLSEVVHKGLDRIAGDDISAQLNLVNKIVDLISQETAQDDLRDFTVGDEGEQLFALLSRDDPMMRIGQKKAKDLPRPETSIAQSSLFTGAVHEPQMFSELKKEIASADRVDMLVSFVKWSGLRLIIDDLQRFAERGGRLRVITTTYMGATDVKAVEALRKLPNAEIRVSYDTERTRLHAKAYMFYRETGFTTAYVGSSNLSNPAMSSGLEWNVKLTIKDMLPTIQKMEATSIVIGTPPALKSMRTGAGKDWSVHCRQTARSIRQAKCSSLASQKLYDFLPEDYYDFIIVDEFHHAAAPTYQGLLNHFKPKILLGLTATPERMDGKNVLDYFNGRIASEIRLPKAIERKLLCPFQYFGVSDDVDLSNIRWTRGGYDKAELNNVFSLNRAVAEKRAGHIVNSLYRYVTDINKVRGLGFCVSVEHAKFMEAYFLSKGIPCMSLTANSSDKERNEARQRLVSGEIRFIFVVDLYNIDFIDQPVPLGFDCPLDLHCTYTRDQILIAMDYMTPKNVREGVKWLPDKQVDVFFITLNKADKDYSPTTMYNDYSINESLFHWQSQSTTSDTASTGQRYINHRQRGSKVVLFVREFKQDSIGAAPYTCLGTAAYVRHIGSRPMNITWHLDQPIPAKYLRKTNKLVVG